MKYSISKDNQVLLLWQSLTKIVNSILSSLILQKSCRNYKKAQQGVPNILLFYLYY